MELLYHIITLSTIPAACIAIGCAIYVYRSNRKIKNLLSSSSSRKV